MAHIPSQSPPPLRHPVPTHPAYIPEPPSTPSSPQGYQRFSSSPGPGPHPQHGQQHPSQNQNPNVVQHLNHMAQQQPGGSAYGSQYGAHVPAYGIQNPFAHQHAQGYPNQGVGVSPANPNAPNGPNPNNPNAFQPDFAAWGIDGTTAQLGMQLGHSAVAAGQQYVQRNFGTIFPSLTTKHHFNVSNSYVLRKLQLVLFPWTHKPWSRKVMRMENGQHEWLPPRDDVNSPDLYIPAMSIVTYILLTGLSIGLHGGPFRPQILGETASRATLIVLFDFLFIKLGCYVLSIQGSTNQVADVIAYSGYKFVGVIVCVILSVAGVTGLLWWAAFVYVVLANAFFLLRSLRSVIFPDPSLAISNNPNPSATVSPAQRRRRITLLFLVAVSQVVYMGALVRAG